MNKVCILVICMVSLLLLPLKGVAQESQTAYNFLRLPVSARAAAVGGDGIALIEDDASLMFHNPALLSSVSDKQLALNFMTYMAGSTTASASFNRAVGERATWAVSGQFMNYGTMKQTDASGQQTGDFSAKDIAMAGYFSYMLSDRIAGGVTAKVVSSFIGDYSSWGVAFDLGVNYYNPESELSASIVAKNLGGQTKAYEEDYDALPFDLQVGVSKRISHTPFRISLTMGDLTHWNYRFADHFTVGVDATLSQSMWIAAGYNLRRSHEMNINDAEGGSSHMAGLSLGAGVSLNRLKLSLAYGKYHVSSSSIMGNVAFSL